MAARLAVVLLLVISVSGCIVDTLPERTELHIVATSYPLSFIASYLAGDLARVETYDLEGKGNGDASFEALVGADLLILNGAGLEPFRAPRPGEPENQRTIVATEGLDLRATFEAGIARPTGAGSGPAVGEPAPHTHDHGHAHGPHGTPDPHTWLDPRRMAQMTVNVRDGLVRFDAENAEAYDQRAQALIDALHGLDERYELGLRNCKTRHLFVDDPVWTYPIWRYDLYQHDLNRLVGNDQALEDRTSLFRVNHYFHPPGGPSPEVRSLADGADLEGLVLHDLTYRSDADRAAGHTYFSLMGQNLGSLRAGLGCT